MRFYWLHNRYFPVARHPLTWLDYALGSGKSVVSHCQWTSVGCDSYKIATKDGTFDSKELFKVNLLPIISRSWLKITQLLNYVWLNCTLLTCSILLLPQVLMSTFNAETNSILLLPPNVWCQHSIATKWSMLMSTFSAETQWKSFSIWSFSCEVQKEP